MSARERMQVRVVGVVQGVGFRPFVHRLATDLDLAGWIRNDPAGVTIEVEGDPTELGSFLARLQDDAPRAAVLYAVDTRLLAPAGHTEFRIVASEAGGPTRAWLLPDLGMCEDCERELRDPDDRRHGYPFLNCTNCGPRYTILEDLPYDRAKTSMKDFVMCPRCRAEYEDTTDRRFHAQPTACAACGPRLQAIDGDGDGDEMTGPEALARAVGWLSDGRIVGVKGLGGYHIVVDAGDEAALRRLRARKRRPAKPFAVMVGDLDAARRWVEVPDFVASALRSPQAPIVLSPRTARGWSEPAPSVAPDCPQLGVFLPYTPVHRVLLDAFGRPVVATSGNPSDQPTIHDDREALESLRGICDAFLVHDRPILRQADDSVLQVVTRPTPRPQLLRRARGFAPLPVLAPRVLPALVGLGGHMNVTFAVARDREVVLAPHLGEMESAEGRAAYRRTLDDLLRLLDVAPEGVVHDLHPDYFTTHLAEELSERWGVARTAVQHHHAHLAAAALEHEIDGEVVALTWDGTGDGGDGTVWGGELLHGTPARSERVGSIVPFGLVGGERSVRQTWRTALSLAHVAFDGDPPPLFGDVDPNLVANLRRLLARGDAAVTTTSMGRLFDGVSALLGLCTQNTHQAQGPQMLEWASWRATRPADLSMPLIEFDGLVRIDWRPAVRTIVERTVEGTLEAEDAAAGFHAALVEAALSQLAPWRERPVLLTGGVFCNRRLSESLLTRGAERGLDLRAHAQLPPTDGGLAAGQVWAAATAMQADA